MSFNAANALFPPQIYDFIPAVRKMPVMFNRIFDLFKVGLKNLDARPLI